MQKNELDSLPELVALGKIGKNQAAMKVLEILYTNPARFGLQTMDEDERSDFLLQALPKFETMLERHNERISPFGAYLFYSIPGMKITWAKKRIEDARGERAMKNSIEEEFKNGEEEPLLEVANPSGRVAQRRRIRKEIFPDASAFAARKKEEFRDIGKIFAKQGRATIARRHQPLHCYPSQPRQPVQCQWQVHNKLHPHPDSLPNPSTHSPGQPPHSASYSSSSCPQ